MNFAFCFQQMIQLFFIRNLNFEIAVWSFKLCNSTTVQSKGWYYFVDCERHTPYNWKYLNALRGQANLWSGRTFLKMHQNNLKRAIKITVIPSKHCGSNHIQLMYIIFFYICKARICNFLFLFLGDIYCYLLSNARRVYCTVF